MIWKAHWCGTTGKSETFSGHKDRILLPAWHLQELVLAQQGNRLEGSSNERSHAGCVLSTPAHLHGQSEANASGAHIPKHSSSDGSKHLQTRPQRQSKVCDTCPWDVSAHGATKFPTQAHAELASTPVTCEWCSWADQCCATDLRKVRFEARLSSFQAMLAL